MLAEVHVVWWRKRMYLWCIKHGVKFFQKSRFGQTSRDGCKLWKTTL